MFETRKYQQDLIDDVYKAWDDGFKNVLCVLATGGGKSHILSKIVKEFDGPCAVLAHRKELIGQLSLTLARDEIFHRIIAPPDVIKDIVKSHCDQFGRAYYDSTSKHGVIAVDTLIGGRSHVYTKWCESIKLFVNDESHHLLAENKWGRASAMMKSARILGVTATPERSDGKGMSHDSHGLFHKMVNGPSMRSLIDMGYLSDYRVFCPPNDINFDEVKVSATTGDYTAPSVAKAIKKSHITGDVVSHYLKHGKDLLGLTFCVNVDAANDTALAFNQAGVKAVVVTGDTPSAERNRIMKDFADRKYLQLVTVNLINEGFNVPGVQIISLMRPTKSLGMYLQQVGRVLRPMPGKTHALIIDHVSNVIAHGLPDKHRVWSMEPRPKAKKGAPSEVIPLSTCVECCGVYEKIHKVCPYCGKEEEILRRDGPQFVSGDLFELDQATLSMMRGEVVKMDRTNEAQWAGDRKHEGYDDSQIYRMFYHKFGVDMCSAQALKKKEAEVLEIHLKEDYLLEIA